METPEHRHELNALLIETLEACCRRQRARIADVESERNSYRELLQAALNALHLVTKQRDRQCERVRVVLRELRQQRGVAA